MLCKKPYIAPDGLELPCGRCMPCRWNRREVWTCRCLLESLAHSVSSFVTLSYAESFYPKDGSVQIQELQEFMKRLRFSLGPVRYLGVGEYGSRTQRAHYHALLFGLNPSHSDLTRIWGKGHCWIGTVTQQSARYCAGYTVKRMTQSHDARLKGRTPEFMRCSLKPGIGLPALDLLEKAHYTAYGVNHIVEFRDVIQQVRIGGKVYPIGRYLTRHLRDRLGLPESDANRREHMLEAHSALRLLPDLYTVRTLRREAQAERAEHMERVKRYARLQSF